MINCISFKSIGYYEGDNTISNSQIRVSPTKTSSGSRRLSSHVYEFLSWRGTETKSQNLLRIIVTLRDHTAAKTLERKGVAVMGGANFGTMYIDSLENHDKVYITVTKTGILTKIKKHIKDGKDTYHLEVA